MYLPLLWVLLLAGVALAHIGRRIAWWSDAVPWGIAVAVAVLALTTVARIADYRDAETLWRQTLASQPNSLYARSNLSAELSAQGRLDEAETLLREVKSMSPGFPGIESGLGLIAFRRDDFEAAVLHYYRATQWPFVKPRDYAYAGYAMTRMGRVADGTTLLEKAVEMDGRDPVALGFMAAFLSNAGRHGAAIPVYRALLSLYPEKSQEWGNLGYSLAQAGRPDEARTAFQIAVERDPDNATILRNAANFEGGQGRFDEALRYADRWRALEPDLAAPGMIVGSLYAAAGQPGRAAAVFRDVAAQHPSHLEALQRLAVCLLTSGDVTGADRVLAQAQALAPGDAGNRAITQAIATHRAAEND